MRKIMFSDKFGLPRDSFPSVTWLSEPKRIRITVETIDE